MEVRRDEIRKGREVEENGEEISGYEYRGSKNKKNTRKRRKN